MINNLKNNIIDGIKKAQNNEIYFSQLYTSTEKKDNKENEFIFFIKPEITLKSESIKIDSILDMMFEKIEQFGLEIKDVKILSAKYLKEHSIISQHYGVINKIASNPHEYLSEQAKENLLKYAETDSFDKINVLGAFQFLDKYPSFNSDSLDVLWQNISLSKLAGGTYCEKVKVDADTAYLLNGFHPKQITHFTQEGRSIVVFTVAGDISWADARQKFIGATNPEVAVEGSLRKELLKRKEEFGISEVNQGSNGFHLSAGPIEGLVELIRYNSNYSEVNGEKTYKDFSLGKRMSELFTSEQIEKIISNINIIHNNKTISIFDLTEEKNSDETLKILKENI